MHFLCTSHLVSVIVTTFDITQLTVKHSYIYYIYIYIYIPLHTCTCMVMTIIIF